jgi:hypothetical protein
MEDRDRVNRLLRELHFVDPFCSHAGVQWLRGLLKGDVAMLKKIILAFAAIGVSSAAFAHDGWEQDRDRGRDHRMERFHDERRPVVEHRPVFVEPAPRVAYAPQPPLYPQPGVSVSVNVPW